MLRDFHELWPERFSNKTNGVTPRRFVALVQPRAQRAHDTRSIGAGWVVQLDQLRGLEPLADDPGFREAWREAKRANKQRLADYVRADDRCGARPGWLFDVQVKRIHEYKRQHLNALHIATLLPAAEAGPRPRRRRPGPSSSAARPRRATSWPSASSG